MRGDHECCAAERQAIEEEAQVIASSIRTHQRRKTMHLSVRRWHLRAWIDWCQFLMLTGEQ